MEHLLDLCVELRSPSTWRDDIGAKKRVDEAGGRPELWLVDHVSNTLVYRRSRPESPNLDLALQLAIATRSTRPCSRASRCRSSPVC